MFVADLPKEMYLLPLGEQRCCDRMYRSIAPPLVVEPSFLVQELEELHVRRTPPQTHIGNLKVRPEVAQIVRLATIVGEKSQGVVGRQVFGA